jgi:AcrR family transcriptional regulator
MAETRQRLLDAALEVFARRGYEGASVKEVAEAAGYTTGALYAHFASKQALFLALLRERFATKVADLQAMTSPGDGTDLGALDRRFSSLREIEADWDLLATEFWLYAVRHDEARAPLVERNREFRAAVAELIGANLAAAGITSTTPLETIAAAVIALGDGLGITARLEPGAVPHQLFATATMHLVLGLATAPVD